MGYHGDVPLSQLLREKTPPAFGAPPQRRKYTRKQPVQEVTPPREVPAPVPLDPPVAPSPRLRQDALREQIWLDALELGYNPWRELMRTSLRDDTPIPYKIECDREVAGYLLPKLKAVEISGKVDVHHTSEPLQVLFAALEEEEEAERETLPPWQPAVLTMAPRTDGVWQDMGGGDDEEEDDGESDDED